MTDTMLPHIFTSPKMLTFEPMLVMDLIDSDEPKLTKLQIEHAEPIFIAFLTLTEDAMCRQSMIDRVPLMKALPNAEKQDPMRLMARRLMLLPTSMKLKIDWLLPPREKERRDTDEPTCRKPMVEMHEPKRANERTEKEEPSMHGPTHDMP
jgi:hypothetical protein